ncbi:tRNA (guanosine(46)-N7)-methyltransferase TrmB [Bifidobacterium biavatii]|uniref:tRNA (guanine-N(7)-)-methyltransferase n=1 Tax=Bifidobacterium biavatii DSM 23969 TaxID=1437608 RepID=A0A086ZXL2_9BIFI|nr:tRNA (guanosine(46)-N7)-methyltransferase TrmB [Bifidobacterium biavatii]KFI51262.1 tRNA (guanine-N(7)-)-methyltransferase [Bifidobacterium biavatii DSM 23969]
MSEVVNHTDIASDGAVSPSEPVVFEPVESEPVASDSVAADRPPLYGRKVLSFVRRSARLDDRLQRAWDAYADRYLLDIAAGEGSLNVRDGLRFDAEFVRSTWDNDRPLIVEIGTGQGENVVAAAAAHPELNFLALEVYDPGVAHTLLLAGKQDLANIRIAQVNAPELFKACDAGVLAEVWTFFPDPWPKMKHHKRRIVQPELAGDVRRALVDGGVWRIATDIEDYALHVHEVMDDAAGFENVGSLTVSLPTEHVGKGNADTAADLPHADFRESVRFEGRVLTNFEKKGLAAGRVIHDFTYRAV